MRVATLTPDKEAEWDAFVVACPQATFFHRAGWKAVIESLGHDTHYLYAEVDGRIDGVLPLGHMQSRLFGNALVSTPFCVYGGVGRLIERPSRWREILRSVTWSCAIARRQSPAVR